MLNTQQLQNDKLSIIKWMSQLEDFSLVEKIKSIMISTDAYLTNEQKNAIDEALKSIETKEREQHHTMLLWKKQKSVSHIITTDNYDQSKKDR
jgi:hypothetical protein